MRIGILASLLGLIAASWLGAVADEPTAPDKLKAAVESLKWQTGSVALDNGLAKINLTDDFRFLGPADAQKVIHDIWGNPADASILGMIFPKDAGPLDKNSWAVAVSYEDRGYVKDGDAAGLKYDDLLKQMQQETETNNAAREKEGYPAVHLVGWAEPPHYDAVAHKLYWARDLKFAGERDDTLNYDIRILGRHGVLVLQTISGLGELAQINAKAPEILAMVDFQPGNTYAEFDPKIDKVAEYGIAGLIAGGVLAGAAKLGLLKGLWIGILALKKFIIIGFVAVAAAVRKFWGNFSGKSKTPENLLPPPGHS